MQAFAPATESDPDVVAAPVFVVLGVQRLMRVGDKMDQKAQRLGACSSAQPGIGKDAPVIIDLSDDAILAGTVSPRVIARRLKRNIDKVPAPGISPLVADFVRPVRVLDQDSGRAQQTRHLSGRGRRELAQGDQSDDLMARGAPGFGRRRRQQQETGEQAKLWKLSKVQ